MNIELRRAVQTDLDAVLALLAQSGLPQDGLTDHLGTILVATENGQIVGSAALEPYRDGALLRSVAVIPRLRGTGLGHRLTQAAIDLATQLGAPAVFLLTTTAEEFFPRFGFVGIGRDAVPDSIQQSIEFKTTCPSTATVMMKPLTTDDRVPPGRAGEAARGRRSRRPA